MEDIIESVFGSKLEYFLPADISIPLYLMDNRRFFRVKLCDKEFILVEFMKNDHMRYLTGSLL